MVSRIRVLDEHTINKIAAGEVIENPSSVIKELVENSLDAQATDICVEIKGGGRQLIRITDNGCGMNGDDALLCLERHATSKIRDVEDIHAIETMGFRGEAIPSIAAISKFTLITCPTNTPNQGTMVIVEGGKILQAAPAVRAPGTTIEVKSLFFNVPVRKKFQKSPAYDANEILKVMSNLALGYPAIKFQLISDSKTLFSTQPHSSTQFVDQLNQRIQDILGSDFLESACAVDITKEDFTLRGIIGLPSTHRPNRTGQYVFINQRAISSSLVSYATRDGYGTSLPTNRHPIFVLHLTLPGSLVDVNVHPQKREVRLRQELILREMITDAVRQAIQKHGMSPHHTVQAEVPFLIPEDPKAHSQINEKLFVPSQVPEKPKSNQLPSSFSFGSNRFIETPQNEDRTFTIPEEESRPFSMPQFERSVVAKAPEKIVAPALPLPVQKKTPRVMATIKHYIILDGTSFTEPQEGLHLVDQRAAHSRVLFEKLLKQIKEGSHGAVQALLLPYPIQTTPVEAGAILQNIESIQRLGIAIHQTGSNAFLVDAIPSYLDQADLQSFIKDLVHALEERGVQDGLYNEREKRLALAASRSAVSRQTRLNTLEAQNLMNQLMQCDMPFQCPQGKQTFLCIPQDDISRVGRGKG
ncbi:MAG: DNA mismatch repair endonuclease MutL [Parachlamydiaceae bacterium]|nr:DNA mismatch repair endonuclease MutL [Parachlamydiaceae bacterium]